MPNQERGFFFRGIGEIIGPQVAKKPQLRKNVEALIVDFFAVGASFHYWFNDFVMDQPRHMMESDWDQTNRSLWKWNKYDFEILLLLLIV